MTGELIISHTNYIRSWVNSKGYPRDIYKGFRHLKDRKVREYLGENVWKTIYSNKTCMRNIEVIILDEANRRFI